MLNIKSNETKKLKFGIAVTGAQARDLKGALRLEVNGIEYGFPAKVVNDNVEVEIPALGNLISEISDNDKFNVKLELIANDTYMVPWSDVAKISVPISVKVDEHIKEETREEKKVSIGVTKVDEETIEKLKKTDIKKQLKEDKPKRIVRTKISKFLEE